MFIVEKGPNQNDPNYANYLYKTEQRLLQYLKDNLHNMKKALKEVQIKSIS